MNKNNIIYATEDDYPIICSLLKSANLPIDGVKEHITNFLILYQNHLPIGTIGLEIYEDKALLRSLAVNKEHQGKGYGLLLSQKIIEQARTKGISILYLLSETAENFFQKFGFIKIARNEVDKQVQNSIEFCSVCPQSAVCMKLEIDRYSDDFKTKEQDMKNIKVTPDTIKTEVKKQYASLINSPGKNSCCGPTNSCCGPTDTMKGNAVKVAGYTDEELKKLPDEAVENSFGCGNPLVFAGVKEGQTVLDIGSGAGIDCFIASEKAGQSGKVIGIDMTPEMVEKATISAKDGGYTQVEFRLGDAEEMPVDNSSVDWVISNCVINLSSDKPKIFKEIYRVLKPGGQFSISDIVIGDNLPKEIAENMSAWTGCIAGAIRESDYITGMQHAGLKDVKVESRIVYNKSMMRGFINENIIPLQHEKIEQLLEEVTGKIWSAKIKGKK